MGSTRCVIANMPRQILGDIVEAMVAQSGDIKVVDRIQGANDLSSSIISNAAEVLVLGMDTTEIPTIFDEVVTGIADILVIGVVDDGRRLTVFVDNAGKNDIPKLIRALRRDNSETEH